MQVASFQISQQEQQHLPFMELLEFVQATHLDLNENFKKVSKSIKGDEGEFELPSLEDLRMYFSSILSYKQNRTYSTLTYWSKHHVAVLLFLLSFFHRQTGLLPHDFTDSHWQSLSTFLPFTTLESMKYKWLSLTHSKKRIVNSWSFKEDYILNELIENIAPGLLDPQKSKDTRVKWALIAMKLNHLSQVGSKLGKHCKERWFNHLSPLLNRGEWTENDDIDLLETTVLQKKKWTKVAEAFPGRTQHQVKNRFLSLVARENGVCTKKISLRESYNDVTILKALCHLKKRFISQKKGNKEGAKENCFHEETKFENLSAEETEFTITEEFWSENKKEINQEKEEGEATATCLWNLMQETGNEFVGILEDGPSTMDSFPSMTNLEWKC